MNLVIVESPTKAKTITKFLGSDYIVESSFGHIRDLPKSKMGIDTTHDYEPEYVIPDISQNTVNKLTALAKKATTVILASDEDREGEAIAWHLAQALDLPKKKIQRIVFHEITKEAILEALKNPRDINVDLVDAQQARRILDRLVGYDLSPFLWKKVARGLSAGRVQSVAVRLTVEKEREIKEFNSEEYWSVAADLVDPASKMQYESHLHKIKNKALAKLDLKNKEQVDVITKEIKGKKFIVANIESRIAKKNPPKPFTTSTLQQAANNMLGYSAKQTMRLAQQLYEGINLKVEGHVGLITYMRTDSLNLSTKFLTEAQDYLKKEVGEEYTIKEPRIFKAKSKGAQEAHEAIRPTDIGRHPDAIKSSLNSNQYRLYKLIWQRSLASQMPEARTRNTTIDIAVEKTDYEFRATGQIIEFDGYLNIYPEKSKDSKLPAVKVADKQELEKLLPIQHFTQPPARYSDATLVKCLEEHGIGRPSTYAPTIHTIIERKYVDRDESKRLFPTDIAYVVNDLLVKHFSEIVDLDFTAKLEGDFDNIAHGKIKWQKLVGDFYKPFAINLKVKEKDVDKKDIMPVEETTEKCEECGEYMIIKIGRFGKFLSCSAFPTCKSMRSLPGTDKDKNGKDDNEQIKQLSEKYKDEVCTKCGELMSVKVGRFGPFLGCSGYPKCKTLRGIVADSQKTGVTCPLCKKGEIIEKMSRRGPFYACNAYPDCKNAYSGKPNGKKCAKCKSLKIETKAGKLKCSSKDCITNEKKVKK
ncbi:type I DNA topoisomerase [Patescibacteria group bacterium]|nr:type I DNA topoisomerase [Patescibacteria group bacterium]